jgi:hypothetical protein
MAPSRYQAVPACRLREGEARREARTGYTTIEGWWADPPGYVDKIVWPKTMSRIMRGCSRIAM